MIQSWELTHEVPPCSAMRLKRLDFLGFKSFPVRAQLAFPPGISAIVGPNGCGKSNIVDAIRWVLGEQSPSLLRGRSMEDVLYSGDRSRVVNFAEVRLLLENGNKSQVPPELGDLPEIEITRRLYRSGDSEYRLNSKVCRLKDIHYLFMDTGAGTRAYSIIDQGQVGSIVEMGPEDRRFLIEEVAGISRYKARRIEAQRRMTQTDQNLDRLEDVLAEVGKHRRASARQAKKTEHFLGFRKEQDKLDHALLAHAWLAEQAKVCAVQTQREELSERVLGLKAAQEGRRLAIEEMEIQLLAEEEALEAMRQEVAVAERDHQGFVAAALRTDERLTSEDGRLRELKQELKDMKRRSQDLSLRAEQMQQERTDLAGEEAELSRKVEVREAGLMEVETSKEELREAVEALKVLLVDAAAKAARLDGRRRGLREREDRLSRQIARQEAEVRASQEQIASIQEKISLLAEAMSRKRKALEELAQKEKDVEQGVRTCSERLKSHRLRLEEIDSKRHRSLARLEALQALEASHEGVSATNRRILESEIANLGILADLLEVASGWERAVEAALGEAVQAVVVSDTPTLQQAVSLVKEKPGSKARLILVREEVRTEGAKDVLPTDSASEKKEAPKGERELIRYVSARPPVKQVVKALLRDWEMVSDLETALAALDGRKANPGGVWSRGAFVTRAGEVVTALGEVITCHRESAPSGVLVRKAELAALRNDIEALEALRDEVHQIRAAEEEKFHRLEASRDDLRRRRQASQKGLEEEEREQDRLTGALSNHQDRVSRITIELEEGKEEFLEVGVSLEEIEEALEEAATAQTKAEGRIRGREQALRNLKQVAARRREALEQHRVQLARMQEQQSAHMKALDGLKRRIEQAGVEREEALSRVGRLTATLEGLRAAALEAHAKGQAQEKTVSEAQSRLAKTREAYDERRQALAGAQADLKSLQREISDLEEVLHKLELSLTEGRLGCENLRRTCWERHRTDLSEASAQDWVPEDFEPELAQARLDQLAAEIERLGPVNLTAVDEYRELDERWTFLQTQKEDLLTSSEDLRQAIRQINRTCRQRFHEAMYAVNERLGEVFPLLFEGGSAELRPTEAEDILDAGVDLLIQLPGKRVQHLNLLSGGEKALAATGLIFAIYLTKPSPFCIMDEVDASLDEPNTMRLNRLLQRIAEHSQVILVTHNQRIMEIADTLYGVTMEEKGVSKLVSVDLVSR